MGLMVSQIPRLIRKLRDDLALLLNFINRNLLRKQTAHAPVKEHKDWVNHPVKEIVDHVEHQKYGHSGCCRIFRFVPETRI